MEKVLHILDYFKKKPKLSFYLYPSLTHINYGDLRTNKEDFQEQYRGEEEPMPHDMSRLRRIPVMTTGFADTYKGGIRIPGNNTTGTSCL